MSEHRQTVWRIAGVALRGCGLLVACAGLFHIACGAVIQSPRAVSANEKIRRSAIALPALKTTKSKTNSVVSLGWQNGLDPKTTIVNQTTGQTFDAGTNGNITLGSLDSRPQTFIATNQFGASNALTVTPAPDTNRLALEIYSYRLNWPGRAGTLQTSSNLVVWYDAATIGSNTSLLVTNNLSAQFYRVRITP